ncbi:MAG: (d)CMP kinase [Chthoniobacterales bacterium]
MNNKSKFLLTPSMLTTRHGVVQQRLRIIAIDGPAASGKSSVAHAIARKLGFLFVSSGHFYRAIAWLSKQHQLDFSDASKISILSGLESKAEDGVVHLFFEGKDLAKHLSDPVVNALVSVVAAMPAVRSFIFKALRALAKNNNLVIEGRDIGSVVFPETPWKFYLDASPEERARRRAKESIIDTIAERDQSDRTRALAPLVIPRGAIVIDTTTMSIEEVLEKILMHLNHHEQFKSQVS